MTDPTAAPPPTAALSSLKASRASSGAPRRRGRRWWLWLLVLAGVAGAVFFAMRGQRPEVQASTVMTAFPSAQYAQLTASGYVVAQRRAAVASKASGRLVELRVREGSVVKAGELIARLDAADVLAGLQAAQAGVRQAEAGRLQADAAFAQARVEQANADAELQRARALQAQGFVSPQAIDANQRRADAARAALASAQAGIAAAQAQLAQARAQVAVQQVGRDSTEIRAPFDGVVLVKNANVGDMITPFSSAAGAQGAVVTMADMSTLEVEADVSETAIAGIKLGQPAEIQLDAFPELRLLGSVSRVVPTVDRSKATLLVKVKFDETDARVLPDMSARIAFLSRPLAAAERKPVTALRPEAVVKRDGKDGVFVVQAAEAGAAGTAGSARDAKKAAAAGGRAVFTPVTLEGKVGELLRVTNLPAGTRVVIDPPAALEDGRVVAVLKK